MKKMGCFLLLLAFVQTAFAADPSEEGVPTSPLTVYCGGISGGAFFALNEELSEESEQFLRLSFINTILIKEKANLFIDVDWFAPGNNYGASLGFDFVLSRSQFQPLIGAGIGAHLFNKTGNEFGEDFGASATAHLGFLLDLTERVLIQVRAPFHIVFNADKDMGMGINIGFLFSDKFRRVGKLNY
jgi:hypothetical protein